MNATKAMLALAMVLTALLSSESAYARGNHHRPHVRFGVVLGGPVWFGPAFYPHYYYPPAYYPPLLASPPVYIEQGEVQPAPAPQQAYWYYCTEAKGYHPYVKECPGGWQRVPPQPPPG